MRGGRRFAPPNGMSISLTCGWVSAGWATTWPCCRGCFPALFVCLSALLVCLSFHRVQGEWSVMSEFRGDQDRTKRFSRPRSTISEREVGSDSLNSATSLAGILGTARNQAGWARANPVPGDFLGVHLDALIVH